MWTVIGLCLIIERCSIVEVEPWTGRSGGWLGWAVSPESLMRPIGMPVCPPGRDPAKLEGTSAGQKLIEPAKTTGHGI